MANLTGILLLNLGTPDNPTTCAVSKYLRQFLSDGRVIELPKLLRWLLVNLVIVPLRSKKSAQAYQKIWQQNGSPLLINSQAICDKLGQQLSANYIVTLGMRYGSPSIAAALKVLQRAAIQELVVLPLFPQYSSAANGSAIQELFNCLSKYKVIPKIRVINEFYQEPGYINVLAASIKPYITVAYDHILMSYHGLPEQQMIHNPEALCEMHDACPAINPNNANCYRAQCYQTSRLLAEALQLPKDKWSVAFQSRLGRLPWIQPFTDVVLQQLSAQGVRKLVICCPSFVADCLETLEEIGIRAREQWQQLGGTELRLVPCLNAEPQCILALKELLLANHSIS